MFLRVASFFPSAKINLAIGFVHEKDGGFTACATLSRGLHAQFATNGISIGCAPCGDAEHCSINCILGCAYSGVRVVDVLRFFTDIQHNHKAMYSCMFSHAVIEMCAYFWPVSREATVSTCTFHPGQAA